MESLYSDIELEREGEKKGKHEWRNNTNLAKTIEGRIKGRPKHVLHSHTNEKKKIHS